ncbi:Oligoribonuclease, mitochondrial [Blomia tropicalis]|nr:Oligoribonuclease, mitochondrial [Blomia tropicalis]
MASSKLINNLIWVDCEMTGLDVEKDQLLEIAVVITDSAYDRKFLNKYCPKFVSNLHYRMVDVSAVKVLVNMWYKDTSFYNKPTEHRALSDIQQSIDELKYYRSKYFKE